MNKCDENANCTNTDGSYNCSCNEGYNGNGFNCTGNYINLIHSFFEWKIEGVGMIAGWHSFIYLQDVFNFFICQHIVCLWSLYSDWFCILTSKYWQIIKFNLLDINECLKNHGGCDRNANCTNTDGSHNCTCHHGYQGDGYNCTGKTLVGLNVAKITINVTKKFE